MAAVFLFAKDISISVSEIEAQAAIDEFLASSDPQTMGVKISPTYVKVDFKGGNRAHIESEIALDGHGYRGKFDGTFSAGIDYRVPRLYLDELQLIDGGFLTDDQTETELSELKNAAINVLRRKRKSLSAEKANNTNSQTSEDLMEEFIIKATKSLFETIPIYDLRRSGAVGTAASLALKDVRFTEDAAVITLSPVTALLRILAAIGFTCLLVAWFLGPTIVRIFLSRSTNTKTNE